jgi:hypothetical protein
MRATGADEFDIKKQVRATTTPAPSVPPLRGHSPPPHHPHPSPLSPLLQVEVQAETEVMIPDTMRRLAKAIEDLRGFISMSESDAAVAGTEQLSAALGVLAELAPGEANGAGAAGGDDERI